MHIDRVAYAKLFNLGDYQNERIELSAVLEHGDDHADSLTALRDEVHTMGLRFAEERGADRDAQYAERGARDRLDTLNAQIGDASARWEKAKAFLEKLGLSDFSIGQYDDIPF